MFGTVPLSIIRCFHCTHSNCICHTGLLCVQWKTPDDGQRNCPKHIEFYFKNKFEKLVYWFYYKNLSRCTVTVTWTTSQLVQSTCASSAVERCCHWLQLRTFQCLGDNVLRDAETSGRDLLQSASGISCKIYINPIETQPLYFVFRLRFEPGPPKYKYPLLKRNSQSSIYLYLKKKDRVL